MAIRFKFRSSATFDSVSIGGRPSISLRDLKSEIARCKNLDTCRDFDLLLSDAVSGREYRDDNCQIPSGSSLIIKRVPAGTAHLDVANISLHGNVEKDGGNVRKSTPLAHVAVENFDDFGEELCPMLEAATSGSCFDGDKKVKIDNEKMNAEFPGCSGGLSVGCTESLPHNLKKANPGGLTPVGNEHKTQVKPKPLVGEHAVFENMATSTPEVLHNSYFPAELKCSLCATFFKDAVMIPCCQHSFCEKCIQRVLIQDGRCPKCLSVKPRVEDLLPNVTLRRAIEHLISSQVIPQVSDNALDHYAPDGESGIHGKEISYGVTNQQMQESPSATDMGSNQVIAEPGDGRLAHMSESRRVTHEQMHGSGSAHPKKFKGRNEAKFQGQSQPTNGEADSRFTRKQKLQVNDGGGERSFAATDWCKKGVRSCYTCGSPDHLMRDCPNALSSFPRFQTGPMAGYPSPLWNGYPLPHFRDFGSLYANAGFFPYNATMVPPTAFTVPNYGPAMFGPIPAYRGGSPVVPAVSPPWDQGCLRFRETQGCDKRQKISVDNLRSERSPYGAEDSDGAEDRGLNERFCYHQAKKENHQGKLNRDRDCFSYDSQRSCRKRQHHSSMEDDTERSGSEVENIRYISKLHGEKQLISHHDYDEKPNHPRELNGSDSSHSKSRRISIKVKDDEQKRVHSNSSIKVKDVKQKRVHSDTRRERREHNSHSDSIMEPSYKKKDSNHGSRHSRRNSRSLNDDLGHERWPMVSGGVRG